MNEDELRTLYQEMIARRSIDGCLTAEQILALADGHAPSGERLAWMNHVGSCPGCRNELKLLQAVVEAGGGKPPQRMPVALALAASLALLIGGVAVWRTWPGQGADVMRGPANRVALISPAGATAIAPTLTLTWHPLPRTSEYEVEVLGADGRPVFATSTADTSVTIPGENSLTPGVEYRWTVAARLADGTRPVSVAQPFTIRTR